MFGMFNSHWHTATESVTDERWYEETEYNVGNHVRWSDGTDKVVVCRSVELAIPCIPVHNIIEDSWMKKDIGFGKYREAVWGIRLCMRVITSTTYRHRNRWWTCRELQWDRIYNNITFVLTYETCWMVYLQKSASWFFFQSPMHGWLLYWFETIHKSKSVQWYRPDLCELKVGTNSFPMGIPIPPILRL